MSFVMVHDESMMLWSCQVDAYCHVIVHYMTWSRLHVYIPIFFHAFAKPLTDTSYSYSWL